MDCMNIYKIMGKVFKLFLMQGKYFWNVLEYNRRKIDIFYIKRVLQNFIIGRLEV